MLVLGDRKKKFAGDVTTLQWISARPPRDIERGLGYGPGRLDAGYWVLLLIEKLDAEDFEFGGTTMRSGGRYGLPAATDALDKARPRVHDHILAERGQAGYTMLQKQVLRNAAITGPNRIAKVLPDTRHNRSLSPAEQYPMGGGGLQWTLVREKPFLVAMHVAADGTTRTPDFTVSLSPNLPFSELYENRAKINRYLRIAGQ